MDHAVKNLETTTTVKAGASVDMGVIDRQISGWVCRVSECFSVLFLIVGFTPRLALKARINSKDELGRALEVAYRQLKTHTETQQADLDNDIKARCI